MSFINYKNIKIFSSCFFFTFLIFYYSQNFYSQNINIKNHRKLLDNDLIKEICQTKSDTDMESKFLDKVYEYNPGDYKSNKWANYIIEYIQNEELEPFAKKYYKRILPYCVFIVFAILLFFFWIGYCCCCCCPCCCCKQKGKENCCRFLSFLIALIMNGVVIVGCVYGLASTKNLLKSANGTTCAISKFYTHLMDGDESLQNPRWVGSNEISSIIQKVIDELDGINEKTKLLSENQEKLEFEYNQYMEYVDNNEKNIENYVVSNPDPDKSENVIPNYAYGRREKVNDLNSYITEIVDSVNSLAEKVVSLKDSDNIVDTKSKLNDAVKQIKDISDVFSNLEDILDNLLTNQKYANKYANKIFYCFFVVIAGLEIISIFLLLFLVGKVCFKLPKCILHIIWNINQIIMIVIFILGGALGIVGVVLTDGIDVFNNVASSENLVESEEPILLDDESTNNYINICFNGNGNINDELDINTEEIDSLNSIYQSYSNFTDLNTDVIVESIDNFTKYYKDLQNNINNVTFKYKNEPNNYYFVIKYLTDFETYSDGNNKNTLQKDKKINHIWKFNYNENYTCPYNNFPNSFTNKNSCYNVSDYKNYDLSSYETILIKEKFSNLKQASDVYLNKFYNFYTDCNDQLNNIIDVNNNYKSKIDNIKIYANLSLIYSQDITKTLFDIFEKYIDEGNYILDIINCQFLGRDKNITFYELDQKFSSNTIKMATDFLTIACGMALGTFFSLIVINRYKEDKKRRGKSIPAKTEKSYVKNNTSSVIEPDDEVGAV
jgi:methyl-accepting chemotaxis protein